VLACAVKCLRGFFGVAPDVAQTPFLLLNTDYPKVIGLIDHYATKFMTVKALILNSKVVKWVLVVNG
jgi:hypothetical protein